MAGVERIRRQQILREAEGYLDLIDLFGDQWVLPETIRRRLAERSLVALDRLANQFVEGPQALLLRGLALRAAERFAEAIEVLRSAAVAEPSRIEVWLALGWCYKRSARLDLAIESLEQALAVDSRQGIVHYNLACYWSLAGQVSQALRYLSQAVAIESGFRRLTDREPDFDPIRDDPGFQSLTSVVV